MIPGGVEVIDLTDDSVPEANTEPEPSLFDVQDSPLLGLPLEVFHLITWYMDAGTFFASLLTCKQFLKAAEYRPNLLRHLYNIPGLRRGLEDLPTSDLLLKFRKRAAESGCAAGVLADFTTFLQTSRTSLSNVAFSPANPSQSGGHAQLAIAHDGGIIQIYELGKNHVWLKAELHIRSEDGNPHILEVLRLAFCPGSRDLAVLYRRVPCQKKKFVKKGVFDHELPGIFDYKLVVFHRVHTSTKGCFYESRLQETRDILNVDTEVPMGLALAFNGHACIAWKKPGEKIRTNIMLIARDDKSMQACRRGQYSLVRSLSLCRLTFHSCTQVPTSACPPCFNHRTTCGQFP